MRPPGVYMKRTRDRPCDKVVTSKNVAFLLSTHLFYPYFPIFFMITFFSFFRHPSHFLPPNFFAPLSIPPIKFFLPATRSNFFTHLKLPPPLKICLPLPYYTALPYFSMQVFHLCYNILLSIQKLTQYIVVG